MDIDKYRLEFERVYKWLVQSSEAQYQLGVANLWVRDVPHNFDNAFEWYFVAASKGHAAAQCDLGFLYHHGLGVEQDYKEAFVWFEKAAKQNHAIAQYNLACIYAKGDGVLVDEKQAIIWCKKAAAQGHEDAKLQLRRIKKEKIKKWVLYAALFLAPLLVASYFLEKVSYLMDGDSFVFVPRLLQVIIGFVFLTFILVNAFYIDSRKEGISYAVSFRKKIKDALVVAFISSVAGLIALLTGD